MGAVEADEFISGCGLVRDLPMGRQPATSSQIAEKLQTKGLRCWETTIAHWWPRWAELIDERRTKDDDGRTIRSAGRENMGNAMIIVPAIILLGVVLWFEKTENRSGLVPTKGLLSCLFVATAVVQSPFPSTLSRLVIAGLVLCLGGDVFLALPQKRMFLLGLISFLVGHILYCVAFFLTAGVNTATWLGSGLAVLVSAGVYIWLRPHLGAMHGPVLAYIVVITVMVSGASSVLGDPRSGQAGRLMLFAGALAFYLSDVFVAKDRFVRKGFVNRLFGLPLYYAGQFLIAFSLGRLGQ
jgi:uncharacterized membrane protein YhhN